MALEINRGQLLALHLGRLKDEGTLAARAREHGQDGQRARRARGRAQRARTILGGNGITLEYPVIRHMNNLETVSRTRARTRCTRSSSARR